jgi:hypothetical protein
MATSTKLKVGQTGDDRNPCKKLDLKLLKKKLLAVIAGIIVITIVTRQIVAGCTKALSKKKKGRNGCWRAPSAKRSTWRTSSMR